MDKQEKYINYVVGDLVKKTEIDYEQEMIKLSFLPLITSNYISFYPQLSFYFLIDFPSYPPSCSKPPPYISRSLSKYNEEIYGVSGDMENKIFSLYIDRIVKLVYG